MKRVAASSVRVACIGGLVLMSFGVPCAQTPAPQQAAAQSASDQQMSNVLVGRYLFGFLISTTETKIRLADSCKEFGDGLRAKAEEELTLLAGLFGKTILATDDKALPPGTKGDMAAAIDHALPWPKRAAALVSLQKSWLGAETISTNRFSFLAVGIALGEMAGQGLHVTAHGASYSAAQHGVAGIVDAQNALTAMAKLQIERKMADLALFDCGNCPGSGPAYMRTHMDAVIALWGPPKDPPARSNDAMIKIAEECYALTREAIQQLTAPAKQRLRMPADVGSRQRVVHPFASRDRNSPARWRHASALRLARMPSAYSPARSQLASSPS
jgi:hypothetical protein